MNTVFVGNVYKPMMPLANRLVKNKRIAHSEKNSLQQMERSIDIFITWTVLLGDGLEFFDLYKKAGSISGKVFRPVR